MPTFFNRIGLVRLLISEPQVVRVAARGIVAFMANVFPGVKRAIMGGMN